MGLHAEEDDVSGTDRRQIGSNLGLYGEVAFGAANLQPAFLHRTQVRSAGVEHDVRPRARKAGSDVAADCAGAGDDDFHDALENACATIRRWILPVAVCGIASVT